jgi:hypothetical protein
LRIRGESQIEDDRANSQLDGVPAVYTEIVRESLNDHLLGQWIRRGSSKPWPSQSPDLIPLEFYLWSYVKQVESSVGMILFTEF